MHQLTKINFSRSIHHFFNLLTKLVKSRIIYINKEEKERYTHLHAEFQRIARRDKKAFLRDQCKEIEENNIIGKTRDIFKKIRYNNFVVSKVMQR